MFSVRCKGDCGRSMQPQGENWDRWQMCYKCSWKYHDTEMKILKGQQHGTGGKFWNLDQKSVNRSLTIEVKNK